MKTFTASRISDGNSVFPAKITIDNTCVTLKVPGFFSGKEKTVPVSEISSVNIDCPLVGYSTIIIETTGNGRIKAHGFKKGEVTEMKNTILDCKAGKIVESQKETFAEKSSNHQHQPINLTEDEGKVKIKSEAEKEAEFKQGLADYKLKTKIDSLKNELESMKDEEANFKKSFSERFEIIDTITALKKLEEKKTVYGFEPLNGIEIRIKEPNSLETYSFLPIFGVFRETKEAKRLQGIKNRAELLNLILTKANEIEETVSEKDKKEFLLRATALLKTAIEGYDFEWPFYYETKEVFKDYFVNAEYALKEEKDFSLAVNRLIENFEFI